MTLKEIIVEETIKEFFGNNELHKYDKDRIEHIADNIISRIDRQVIASGEVKNIVYQTGQVVITFNKLPEQLSAGNIICGKNIEIAVRVKEE